jgi:hypothetical protein
VIEKRKLGSPETLIIHVGTNELRRMRNLDFVTGEVHALVATAKRKFPKCRLIMSEVVRRRDVLLRRIGAFNDRKDWLANALTLNSVDPNSWIEDGDFARDGLHLNKRGKRRLGQIYARVSELDIGGSQGVRCDEFWKKEITESGIPGKRDDRLSKNRRLYVKKMDQ